jgi:hypothetical protein
LEQIRLAGRQQWVLQGKAGIHSLDLEIGITTLGRKLDHFLVVWRG